MTVLRVDRDISCQTEHLDVEHRAARLNVKRHSAKRERAIRCRR